MRNKIVLKTAALAVVFACLLACAAGTLTACDKTPEEHDVLIEVINPYTGEPIAYPHHAKFPMPAADTPIEIRVKDRVTGKYLTDSDLKGSSLDASTSVSVACYSDWSKSSSDYSYVNRSKTWPGEDCPYTIFKITVNFTYPLMTEEALDIGFDFRCKWTTVRLWCEYI